MHFNNVVPRYHHSLDARSRDAAKEEKDGYAPGSAHLAEVSTRTASLVVTVARLKRPMMALYLDRGCIEHNYSVERGARLRSGPLSMKRRRERA